MKKIRKYLVSCILIFAILIVASTKTFASNMADILEPVEYTEEFEEYIELSEEERAKVIQPKIFEVKRKEKKQGLLKSSNLLRSSLETKFTLQDVIANNLVVKDQKKTNSCWAFASIASLETNLALTGEDKSKVYDFSERHMNYATTRIFKDNAINKTGFDRKVEDGGDFLMALAYLTNGTGAINEEDMPFEDNNDTIDISEIQNKKVTAQVYDTISFQSYKSTDDKTQIKTQMKEHIKKYGAIAASVYGADLINDYYNNNTGALYCDDETKCPVNHAVAIVGWDDNFNVDNFNEAHRPENNGAWIVKNSWGTVYEEDVTDYKKTIYENLRSECSDEELEQQGITDYTSITDEMVKSTLRNAGFEVVINDNKLQINVGKDGFMYISYEDVNLYSNLIGIIKSSDSVDYENIYQYDILGMDSAMTLRQSKVYLANIFDKKTTGKEYLTQVSLDALETYTCKVYVNPNGSNTDKNSLQAVELKEGNSETFDAGYHTIEFAKPIEIKSDKFVVMVEIEGTTQNSVSIAIERNIENSRYDVVEIEDGKCLLSYGDSFNNNEWLKLSELNNFNQSLPNSDSTIKAFTVSKVDESLLDNGDNANSANNSDNVKNEESGEKAETKSENSSTNTKAGSKSFDEAITTTKKAASNGTNSLMPTSLPYTGIQLTIILFVGAFTVIAVITYRQIKKYRDI